MRTACLPNDTGGKARPGTAPTLQAALGYRLAASVEGVVTSWWEKDTTRFPDVTWKRGTLSCQVMWYICFLC